MVATATAPKKKTLVRKLTKKSTAVSKHFDMTPAGKVVYYPDFEGLPIRKGSNLTPAMIKLTLDKMPHNKCAWYCNSNGILGANEKLEAPYTHCHAGISDAYLDDFYLDLIYWNKMDEKQAAQAKKVYAMLVSKDSPWADSLENVYLLMSPDDRLLGLYVRDMREDILPDCRLLFLNLCIAARTVSEHINMRKAWAAPMPTKTVLGWFVYASLLANVKWHNWPTHHRTLGKDWLKGLFKKNHNAKKAYGAKAHILRSHCNDVFEGDDDPSNVGVSEIIEVEKELGYV